MSNGDNGSWRAKRRREVTAPVPLAHVPASYPCPLPVHLTHAPMPVPHYPCPCSYPLSNVHAPSHSPCLCPCPFPFPLPMPMPLPMPPAYAPYSCDEVVRTCRPAGMESRPLPVLVLSSQTPQPPRLQQKATPPVTWHQYRYPESIGENSKAHFPIEEAWYKRAF
ncbi:keratinocyte proline-rich protein-like [Penaeus japonicus]|uniref:keratinocyte proline-rich protein-like n=1 Tax=Penaeus japonicus TaxID=27405 RepID=UPI001C70CB7A|nr:keratinocyte proline-rich protein-like [Penaeus japonicus]